MLHEPDPFDYPAAWEVFVFVIVFLVSAPILGVSSFYMREPGGETECCIWDGLQTPSYIVACTSESGSTLCRLGER